jgi:ankyrin repeat protein
MPRDLNYGQKWFMDKMTVAGYQVKTSGQCFGVARMGMNAFLANDMTTFLSRMEFIKKQDDSYFLALSSERVRLGDKVKKGDEFSPLDISEFFDGVQLMQEPFSYEHLFKQKSGTQFDLVAQEYVMPQGFIEDKDKIPEKVDEFNNAFNQEELTQYLNLLQEGIDVPTSIQLISSNHAIEINYDPEINCWYMVDANQLSIADKKWSDNSELASAIIKGFKAGHEGPDNAIFYSQIYTQKANVSALQDSLEKLKENKAWKSIHEVTEQRSKRKDAFDGSWLKLAKRSWAPETIKNLIHVGADVDESTSNELLELAVENGNANLVEELLEKGVNPSKKNIKGETPLFKAAANGHAKTVKVLLDGDIMQLSDKNKEGETALFIAAKNGHIDIVNELIERGAYIHDFNRNAESLMYVAAKNGQYEIVQELMDKGAVFAGEERNKALFIAAKNGHAIYKKLIENKKDANLEEDGERLLITAAKNGHHEIVKRLLKKGAKFEKEERKNVLFIAAKNGHYEILKELIKKKDANLEEDGKNLLITSVENGHANIVKKLLKKGFSLTDTNKEDEALLEIAVKGGHLDVVNLLIDKGAKLSQENTKGQTLFDLAIDGKDKAMLTRLLEEKIDDINEKDGNGETLLQKAVRRRHVGVVEALIDAGADVNQEYNDGETPLLIAAKTKNTILVKALLEKGANINQQDKNGLSPLHIALNNNHKNLARLLIAKGADINQQDENGFSPLHIALNSNHKNLASLLIAKGADINQQDENGFSPLHIAINKNRATLFYLLIEKGVDVNQQDEKGCSPLHVAVENGHGNMAKALLDSGADVTQINKDGETPLHIAVKNGQYKVVKALLDSGADMTQKNKDGLPSLHVAVKNGHNKIAKLLMKRGADINQKDEKGCSPLHFAAETDSKKLVKLLIEKGADINAQNNDKQTPLHLAAVNGTLDVFEQLLKNGANLKLKNNKGQTPLEMAKEQGNKQVVDLMQLPESANNIFDRLRALAVFKNASPKLEKSLGKATLKDEKMDEYINSQKALLNDDKATGKEKLKILARLESLATNLKGQKAALQFCQKKVRQFIDKKSVFTMGMQKKAKLIAKALCDIPVEDRVHLSSTEDLPGSVLNLHKALATHRHPFRSNCIHTDGIANKKNMKVDEKKAPRSYKEFKHCLQCEKLKDAANQEEYQSEGERRTL